MSLTQIELVRCGDVVIIAVIVLLVDICMNLWNKRGTHLTAEEIAVLKQYNEQVRIVNKLNSVETFVEQSKAIRRMNALKKEMQELAVQRMQNTAPTAFQKRFDQMRTPVLMAFMMFYYWNDPLVVISQGTMMPFERFLAFPGFPLGAISAVGWASVCRRAASKMLS
ncbi:TPA: hypothetical protein N0F65_000273 [Lagenidium giganteum]|uniref:Tryptophan-rich basic protein n=1 Tax=Lagenidium giganteum TaxID=4803 RepID=A0AAV2Z6U2_9STRA|nr:TPA: hypothetical protein N0F65_000273 [Lagenidium giganteum]